MAIKTAIQRFSKPGKGFPQVEQLDDAGNAILKDGKPVIGNEQYTCNQLISWEEEVDGKKVEVNSISSDSAESFLEDVLESVNGDLELAAEMFRIGWNRVTRIGAAGLDEYQKAAKGVIKLGLAWTKGLSVDEVADKLKAMNG